MVSGTGSGVTALGGGGGGGGGRGGARTSGPLMKGGCYTHNTMQQCFNSGNNYVTVTKPHAQSQTKYVLTTENKRKGDE